MKSVCFHFIYFLIFSIKYIYLFFDDCQNEVGIEEEKNMKASASKNCLVKLVLAATMTFGMVGCSGGGSSASNAPRTGSNNTNYQASKIELADMNDPEVVDSGLVFIDSSQLTSSTTFTYQGSVVSFTGFKRDQMGPQNIIMAYNKDNAVKNNKVTVFVGTPEEFAAYQESGE